LTNRNPFATLGLHASRGRRDTQPPTQGEIASFVALADDLTPPSFAAYLDVAVYEGMRPGELDALRWTKIDFQAGTVLIDEQWNALERAFTLPKHGFIRTIALTDPARERLLRLPRESEFVFTTLRGSHYRRRHARITGTGSAAPPVSATSTSTPPLFTTSAGTPGTSSSSTRGTLRFTSATATAANSSESSTATRTRSSPASVSARRSGRRPPRRYHSSPVHDESHQVARLAR
jgi:hypothetical protein